MSVAGERLDHARALVVPIGGADVRRVQAIVVHLAVRANGVERDGATDDLDDEASI